MLTSFHYFWVFHIKVDNETKLYQYHKTALKKINILKHQCKRKTKLAFNYYDCRFILVLFGGNFLRVLFGIFVITAGVFGINFRCFDSPDPDVIHCGQDRKDGKNSTNNSIKIKEEINM